MYFSVLIRSQVSQIIRSSRVNPTTGVHGQRTDNTFSGGFHVLPRREEANGATSPGGVKEARIRTLEYQSTITPKSTPFLGKSLRWQVESHIVYRLLLMVKDINPVPRRTKRPRRIHAGLNPFAPQLPSLLVVAETVVFRPLGVAHSVCIFTK